MASLNFFKFLAVLFSFLADHVFQHQSPSFWKCNAGSHCTQAFLCLADIASYLQTIDRKKLPKQSRKQIHKQTKTQTNKQTNWVQIKIVFMVMIQCYIILAAVYLEFFIGNFFENEVAYSQHIKNSPKKFRDKFPMLKFSRWTPT